MQKQNTLCGQNSDFVNNKVDGIWQYA